MNKKQLLYILLAGLMSQSVQIKAMDYDDMSVRAADKFSEKQKEREEREGRKERRHERRHDEKRRGKGKRRHERHERHEREEREERKERKCKDKSGKKCEMRDKKESGKKHGWIFSRRNRSENSDK